MLKDSGPDSLSQAIPLYCDSKISNIVVIMCFHVHIMVSVVSEFTGIVYCVLLACLNTYAVKTKGFNGTFIVHVHDWRKKAFY